MKNKNYKYILLFITATIVCTIVLQFYWNIKNYKENKAQLTIEVQNALDKSIEYYYMGYLKDNIVAFTSNDKNMDTDQFIKSVSKYDAFKKSVVRKSKNKKKVPSAKQDSIITSTSIHFQFNSDEKNSAETIDSIQKEIKTEFVAKDNKATDAKVTSTSIDPKSIKAISIFKGQKDADSVMNLKNLANKIMLTISQDTIELQTLSNAFEKELKRKNITIDYKIEHFKSDTVYNSYQSKSNSPLTLHSSAKSVYLPKKSEIKIQFSDPVLLILKRSQTEILLSLLLSLSIISCLLYLLRTINKQKKIDEIKNDLISNITHEFKTPITTISTAIEGLKSFNTDNDVEKTNRYLTISSNQLKKLEVMVEHLLETATLDTNQLIIKKETTDLLQIVKSCIEKQEINCVDKTFLIESNLPALIVKIDPFHIENVISNLIDNSVKYGGNSITVLLNSNQNSTSILIKDNGIGIDKSLNKLIFEKFYRIPRGNIHDIKGFGIGLYYSKKIIEKHGGTLELTSNSNPTAFKITLFNEN